MDRSKRRPFGLLFAVLTGACAPPAAQDAGVESGADVVEIDVTLEDRVFVCNPLRIVPAMPRVATERAISLRIEGGSGIAPLRIEGESLGAYVEPGGGFRAGRTAGRVTVVATDANCNATARSMIEIVGPFSVTPERATVARGGMTTFTAANVIGPLRYEVFSRPAGAGETGTITAAGVFTAGSADGEYQIVATDDGAQKSTRVVVEVGAGTPLRPRFAVLAVPGGGRVRLQWEGGSGSYRYALSDMARGRVVTEGEEVFFEAGTTRGFVDVTATDAASGETARVRVLVSDEVSPAPLRRGLQTQAGDLAVGDVNGDGRQDLIVGHAERSVADTARGRFTGRNAGGVLVYHGAMDGSFPSTPSAVIEGENTEDRFGSVLLVRDVNADGMDDVLVGVPDSDLGESDRGAFGLYLGSRDGVMTAFERVLNGEDINDRYGSAIAVADLNGDMAPELIVGAPNAVRPMDRARATALRCNGGRVYIYRGIARVPGAPPVRGVFESIPWQVLDVQAPLSDTDGPPACAPFLLGAGRALALIDVDNDRKLDLAVGAPNESHGMGVTTTLSHGVVLVYRGVDNAQFERTPAWSIQLPLELRVSNAQFGQGLDVVRDGMASALVVRSFTFSPPGMTAGSTVAQAGGLWVFPPSSFMAPLSPVMGGVRPVRVVNATSAARFAYGDGPQRGLGRHATVGDFDGDGAQDYVVSGTTSTVNAMLPGMSGGVYSFSSRDLISGAGRLTLPARVVDGVTPAMGTVPTELTGLRVAAVPGAMGQGAGLAVWHGWRDTTWMDGGRAVPQPFGGAIEYVPPGAGAVAARWGLMDARRSVALPVLPAGERAGSAVLLGGVSASGTMEAVVSAPFAHSPMTPTARAAQIANVGSIELYPAAGAALGRYAKTFASNLQAPTILLDFDGDGTMELAVGERTETFDSRTADVPSECKIIGTSASADGGVTRTNQSLGSRGIVHVYKLVDGQFVERWRAVSRSETRPLSGTTLTGVQLNQFGASLSAADVDGDGRDDLIVGRIGGVDSNGAEVVRGRPNPSPTGIMTVCNTGDAYAVGPHGPTDTTYFGLVVDGLGDLNGDGCDEVAVSMARNGAASNPSAAARAGFAVVFGANADGMRAAPPACAFRRPMVVHVVPDERLLGDNADGDLDTRANDNVDLAGIPGTMGRVFALGAGDLDGDRSSDVVYRTADLAFGPFRGAAVEVLSGRSLALCVAGSCPAALRDAFVRDGDYMALGVRTLGAPHRWVAPTTSAIVTRWGSALALADVTGDGAAELFIGSPDDSVGAEFSGAVFGYRGGAGAFTQGALTANPWMLAVGALRERGDFGAAIAAASNSAAGSWLLVGSPLASRAGAGGELGAGYRWRVEVPR